VGEVAGVLVASSDEFLSDAVAHALGHDQHAVDRATSWRSAERSLPELRPHLVVIDAGGEGVPERPVVGRVRMVTNLPLVVRTSSPHLEDRLNVGSSIP
jgi:DNA-binding response OmpR family regulator